MFQFRNLHEAYPVLLSHILSGDYYSNAPRGYPEKEKIGVSFSLSHPTERGIYYASRKFNLAFCLAEAVWYLSGRNDLAFIEQFASRMRDYSADGVCLPGTGYGKRIFSLGAEAKDQWRHIVDLLTIDDAQTKRAVLQLYDGRDNLHSQNIDVCCTLGLQFLLRDGKLDCVAFMRANDFYRGLVSDVFSFTILQECLAREIGAKVGRYCHTVGSAHVYDLDEPRARAIIKQAEHCEAIPDGFPEMPSGPQRQYARSVMEIEARTRSHGFRLHEDPDYQRLPEYWRDVACVFYLHHAIKRNRPISDKCYESLSPVFKSLMKVRWPDVNRIGESQCYSQPY